MNSRSTAPSAGPLAGIKVLDFGHMVMGPTCGLILADLGAEVVRVEPPGEDPTRRLKGAGMGFFSYFNRNKSSVMFDLKKGEDASEIGRRALQWADVVIENFAPGVMKGLGLDYDSAKAVNPRLVYCSLKGFFPGPYEDRLALDEVAQMMGGMAYMTGPEGRPLRAGGSVVDITGGMFGVIGVLAALRERDATGLGTLVQGALFETAAFFTGQHMAYHAMTGEIPKPMPSRDHMFSVYDLFSTQDDTVFLAVTSEQQWHRFCETFGFSELLSDPEMATQHDRLAVRPRLIAEVAKRFSTLRSEVIVDLCVGAKLPVARVNRPDQVMHDRHLRESGQLIDIQLSNGSTAALPALPLRMGGRVLGVRSQPMDSGTFTAEFLHDLGFAAPEVERLEDSHRASQVRSTVSSEEAV